MSRNASLIEDEIGDVLEKAMRTRRWSLDDLSGATGICRQRLQDALDYRHDLQYEELIAIAGALRLNEVGLCALGAGNYPLPEPAELPFAMDVIPMRHGVGQVNAYVITSGLNRAYGLLFDTGPNLAALLDDWPREVGQVDAVLLTHVEGEHTGGLCDVVAYFGIKTARTPPGAMVPCGQGMGEGENLIWQDLEITALATPGHAASHNCYYVRKRDGTLPGVLIAGDLIFAGSVGGAYYDEQLQHGHVRRILSLCPEDTIIAPGHGPLTTVRNERQFNPFVG